MEQLYEIQIQCLEGNNVTWYSTVDENNHKIYIFPSEEEAYKDLEKIQNENYPKQCRVVKL